MRLWTSDFHETYDLSAADEMYVAQVVAARAGLSQADAEKRVRDVIAVAKLPLTTRGKAQQSCPSG